MKETVTNKSAHTKKGLEKYLMILVYQFYKNQAEFSRNQNIEQLYNAHDIITFTRSNYINDLW